MSCHPGGIWGRCLMEGYKVPEILTPRRKEKELYAPFLLVEKTWLALGSLQSHLRTQHGMDAPRSIIPKSVVFAPRSYKLSFMR